jgi:cAMP-dependent protein kinase regulator
VAPVSAEDNDAEMAKVKAAAARPRRRSFSSEPVGQEAVSNYNKPVFTKDPEKVAEIKQAIKDDAKMQVLFGHLEEEQVDDVVNAFHPKEFSEGSDIIVQGDNGDCLYIVDSGSVDVFVARPGPDGVLVPGDRGVKAVTLSKGALFGELALMYNAPRAATVTAASEKVNLWVLDALDFKMLLMQKGQSAYKRYEGWLSDVKFLKALNQYELSKLADALQSMQLAKGEDIIQQGETSDRFFILEKGSAAAFMAGDDGEKLVKTYSTVGDYFGEVALITEEPRRATVRAGDEGCTVASLSKDDFASLLGPVNEILKDLIAAYPTYAEVGTAG